MKSKSANPGPSPIQPIQPIQPVQAAGNGKGPKAAGLMTTLCILISLSQSLHAARPSSASSASKDSAPAPVKKGPRILTVLDPVNLTNSMPDPEAGAILRAHLKRNPAWQVPEGDSTARLLREFNLDPDLPCAEFQCAFDAGNALQSEFVLFGTATSLPALHAFTLDLVHVPTSQVVWSRVGEAPKRQGAYTQSPNGLILKGSLSFAVSDLDPASLHLRRRPSMGLLGVMDAGQSTPHSRVALHRALSHAYASRGYDLLGPAEMDELMAALDFGAPADVASTAKPAEDPDPKPAPGPGSDPKGTGGTRAMGWGGTGTAAGGPAVKGFPPGGFSPGGFSPGGNDMYELGGKMGIRYLLWTKVENAGRDYKMELALYDVAGRKLLRHWPARQSPDFNSLLGIEDRFMTVLGNESPVAQAPEAPLRSGARTFGKIASIGLAVAAGATLGYLAYQDKQDADREYARLKTASTKEEAEQARMNVEEQEARALQFGVLGGISLALGAAVWVF